MFLVPWSRSWLRKTEAGAAKNMSLLYRLPEDQKYKEIVHLLLFFNTFLWLKTQLFYLFYISCCFTQVVCGEKNISPNLKNS